MPGAQPIPDSRSLPCMLNRTIDNKRFFLESRLGCGGYGVVYLGIDLHSSSRVEVAVKCLLLSDDDVRRKHEMEVSLHRRASRLPGVVRVFREFEEDGYYFILLELCKDGDLFTMISETKLYLGQDQLIKGAFLQLLDTVHGLHTLGIYHRDLKPENIMVSKDGSRLLITDFGLATERMQTGDFGFGSYFYMTPECIAGCYTGALRAYSSRAADIWALGVILINMITSRSPWKSAVLSDNSFHQYTRNPRWLREILPLSEPAYRFIGNIFSNHGNNLSLSDLRRQFIKIDTFYMRGNELANASKTARLVAKEWMPDTPTDDILPGEILPSSGPDEDLFDDGPLERNITSSSQASLSTIAFAERLLNESFDDLDDIMFRTNTDWYTVEHIEDASQEDDNDGSDAESEGPITPETHAVEDPDVVPDDFLLEEKLQICERPAQSPVGDKVTSKPLPTLPSNAVQPRSSV